MEALKLKPKHEDTLIAHLLSLKANIEYFNTKVITRYSEMTQGEIKEHNEIYCDYLIKFNSAKKAVIENETIFNELLNEYDLTVETFIYCIL